ncbi:LacI family DNA-binding transcriptional regulator [Mycolicibacterium parafortuitum]|uniref:LacI family DNA-binding transcriptional regulator n=1 Tax=Mycolicibacterium parafortuitum TaxID=39692 RepID=UPI0032C477CD
MNSRVTPTSTAKPVMADVARLAGVSHQTVSRVINGSPSIRPATKARVQQAIEELGYRPNTAARALVTRRSGIIGIIGTSSALFGPSSVQRSVQEAARAAGYFTSMVPLPDVTPDALRDALEHLTRQSVEAIVMIAAQEDALAVAHAAETGVPMIVVEGDLSGSGLSVGGGPDRRGTPGHHASDRPGPPRDRPHRRPHHVDRSQRSPDGLRGGDACRGPHPARSVAG